MLVTPNANGYSRAAVMPKHVTHMSLQACTLCHSHSDGGLLIMYIYILHTLTLSEWTGRVN